MIDDAFDPQTVTESMVGRLNKDQLHRLLTERFHLPVPSDTRKDAMQAWAHERFALADGRALEAGVAPGPGEGEAPVGSGAAPDGDVAVEDDEPSGVHDISAVKAGYAVVPRSSILAPEKWTQLLEMGRVLCKANLVPSQLRGDARAPDVTLVLMAAHDLGIQPYQAFTKLHVIDGKLSMSAELMVSLILAAGHKVWPDENNSDAPDADVATVWCIRSDDPNRPLAFSFTLAEAREADLLKKDNWKHYRSQMLWARAVSKMARRRFPDVLAGISYTPEELGDESWNTVEEAGVDTPDEPSPEVAARVERCRDRIAGLDETQAQSLKAAWKEAGIPPLGRLREGVHVAIIEGLLDRLAPEPVIDDAEIIEGGDAHAQPDDPVESAGVAMAAPAYGGMTVEDVAEGDDPNCQGCGERLFNGEPISDAWLGFHRDCEPFSDAPTEPEQPTLRTC